MLPLPPIDEQRAIGAFLDQETERFDSLVAKIRLLIERLGEYRSALITRTVTRGLPRRGRPLSRRRSLAASQDPRVWRGLGEVPEHWEVKRLSLIGSFYQGRAAERQEDRGGGASAFGSASGTDDYLHPTSIRVSEGEFMNALGHPAKRVRPTFHPDSLVGDILFAKDSGETVGVKSASQLPYLIETACLLRLWLPRWIVLRSCHRIYDRDLPRLRSYLAVRVAVPIRKRTWCRRRV